MSTAPCKLASMLRPDAGDLIPGSGGLRKFRWSLPGKGNAEEQELIYYWQRGSDVIYMLFSIRQKPPRGSSRRQQLRTLSKLVKENLK